MVCNQAIQGVENMFKTGYGQHLIKQSDMGFCFAKRININSRRGVFHGPDPRPLHPENRLFV